MKRLAIAGTFLLMATAQAGELKLVLYGEGIAGESIRVALYNSAQQFGSEDKFFKSAITTATGDSATVIIADVPPGKYAVAAYADRNGNGKQDTNFLGKPTERYGFSNNARGLFGPPDYDEAVFEVGPQATTQSIQLK